MCAETTISSIQAVAEEFAASTETRCRVGLAIAWGQEVDNHVQMVAIARFVRDAPQLLGRCLEQARLTEVCD